MVAAEPRYAALPALATRLGRGLPSGFERDRQSARKTALPAFALAWHALPRPAATATELAGAFRMMT